MKRILLRVITLLAFLLFFSSVQAEQPVGYVEKLDGPGNAFQLYRNGEKQLFAPMTALYVGDRIEIFLKKCKNDDKFQDTCTLTFIHCEQQRVHVESSLSPYTVPENFACQSPSWPVGLLEWAAKPFKKYHQESRQIRSLGTTMSGSDEALVLPLLANDNARLTAGERTFYFCWRGGEAPYQIRIYREGSDTPILEQADVQENRLKQEGYSSQREYIVSKYATPNMIWRPERFKSFLQQNSRHYRRNLANHFNRTHQETMLKTRCLPFG